MSQEMPKQFVQQCFDANELGDGALFAAIHQGRYLYVASQAEWYRWDAHHWKLDKEEHSASGVEDVALAYLNYAQELGKKITELGDDEKDKKKQLQDQRKQYLRRVDRLRTDRGVRNTLRFARIGSHALAIEGTELDQDPWLLGVANGVIDLRTGILRDGHPEDYITIAAPVEWQGIDAEAPTWDDTLHHIFNSRKDVIYWVGKTLGYALTGKTTHHDFCAWHGRGRNGKTVLMDTVAAILGDYVHPVPAELLLEQPASRSSAAPSPDIMQLKGIRIAYAEETDEGRKFSASRVKWLSGGGSLTGRWPNDKRPQTFAPTHSLFLLTNHKPKANPDDYAFWERLHLLRFENSYIVDREPIPEANEYPADPELPERLLHEAPGILAWLVRHCMAWQRDGHIKPPPFVKEATAEYRREEDVIQEWIDDAAYVEEGAETRATILYAAFSQWYEANIGKRVPSPKWFGKQLALRFTRVRRGHGQAYVGISVPQEEVFHG